MTHWFGKNITLPEWQKKNPSELAKYDPSRLAKAESIGLPKYGFSCWVISPPGGRK